MEKVWGMKTKKEESVPLQRVSVAPSDQRQLEGTDAILEREAFLRGCREPLEVTDYKNYTVGATPTG